MIMTNLQGVAHAIVRRAQNQGFVIPREIREELSGAGLPDDLWKEVIALAQPSLTFRQGRYYYVNTVSSRMELERYQQRVIQRALRQLIRDYKTEAARNERRHHGRIDFIQPVKVLTEDGRELTLLTRDISTTGIRLIGARSLLGQKIRVLIARGEQEEPRCFIVRVLWTCAIGDDLFENGGNFLEMVVPRPEPAEVAE
jgi:PilZ domain